MKKLIILLIFLPLINLFGQGEDDGTSPLLTLFRASEFVEAGGNLYGLDRIPLYDFSTPKVALSVLPAAPYVLGHTGAQVEAILDKVDTLTLPMSSLNVFDDGLTTQILVGGGSNVVPVWGTDIPTAVTIGSAYIYRVGGTDVADGDVADNITIDNTLITTDSLINSGGGTFGDNVTVTGNTILNGTVTSSGDNTIIEATPLLNIVDSDANTGGGALTYDSSAVIIEADGSPSITLYGTDGDANSIGINTSDRLEISGGGLYLTGQDADQLRIVAGDASWDARMHFDTGGSNEEWMLRSNGTTGTFDFSNVDIGGMDYFKLGSGGGFDVMFPRGFNYAADTSSTGDAYKIVLASVTSYAAGQQFWVNVSAGDNTGACTLTINALTPQAIKTQNGSDPAAGYIDANSVFGVVYDGTNFVLTTPNANP